MLCQRCGERDAEIFQTQQVVGKTYTRDLCSVCAKADYGIFLVRRVLDDAAPPPDEA